MGEGTIKDERYGEWGKKITREMGIMTTEDERCGEWGKKATREMEIMQKWRGKRQKEDKGM